MKYDVAVIGGGLAGLALSIDLAERGRNVVVIEKGDYPRHKVCGEYISMESYEYLIQICPQLSSMNLPIIKKFKLTSTGSRVFETELDLGGFGISRYRLEELLYEQAKSKGVEILTQTKAIRNERADSGHYIIHTNGENLIEAKLVCNSTGRKSNFEVKGEAKSKETTNYIGVKYHVELERDVNQIEIHNFPGGYCGISSIESGKACLCYIVNSEKLKQSGHSMPKLEEDFLYANNNLKQIFQKAKFVSKEPITISGINFKFKRAASDDSLYLGDSAGSVAPIIGNGMSMGLRSACKLAAEIDKYLDGKNTEVNLKQVYSIFWKEKFNDKIKLSRHLQKLSELPTLTNATIFLFGKIPFLATRIIKMTHGKSF